MGKFTFIKLVTEQQLTVCSLGIIPASYSHLGQQISLDHIEFCVKLYTEYSLVYKIQTKNNVSVFSDWIVQFIVQCFPHRHYWAGTPGMLYDFIFSSFWENGTVSFLIGQIFKPRHCWTGSHLAVRWTLLPWTDSGSSSQCLYLEGHCPQAAGGRLVHALLSCSSVRLKKVAANSRSGCWRLSFCHSD